MTTSRTCTLRNRPVRSRTLLCCRKTVVRLSSIPGRRADLSVHRDGPNQGRSWHHHGNSLYGFLAMPPHSRPDARWRADSRTGGDALQAPCLVTDVGDNATFVHDGVTAFLAPGAQLEAVSAALERTWPARTGEHSG
jgi:hypothetical protein